MSINLINIGNLVNDGLGDDLRTAFQKVNANFAELEQSLIVNGVNLGSTGEGIFRQISGSNLEFKSLVPGNKITLDSNPESIIINNSQPDSFVSITTNAGIITANNDQGTTHLTVQGGNNINVTASSNVVTIDTVTDLNQVLSSFDFGPITGPYQNIFQFLISRETLDFGTIDEPTDLDLFLGEI